uniref:eCIS core domain-containing protein n=1 Tax=Natronobiforma cellulositropha TaxID=1679076 RepID=UPI0021D5A472
MSFDRDWRGRSNDDSEQNERTRRARAQPQTQGGTRPHQYLSSVLRPSPEQAAQLDRLIQTRGFEQVQRWGERGELPEGCNTPTGEQVRVARVRSSLGAGVELDTESAMRSVEAQAESDLAGETATPEVVRRVISQPGKPLEGAVREEMEQRMGDSFSDVQLHTGPEAAKAASTLEARAFTTGNHVVFNRGEYDPESPEGKYLLAHELAHVRQQTGGAISMLPQEGSSLVIDPDPELEREADEVARKALEGDEPIVAHRLGMEVHIQRAAADDGMLYGAVEDLQEQVDGLEERQSQLMGTMLEAAPGASEDFDVAGAAAKGLAGFGA